MKNSKISKILILFFFNFERKNLTKFWKFFEKKIFFFEDFLNFFLHFLKFRAKSAPMVKKLLKSTYWIRFWIITTSWPTVRSPYVTYLSSGWGTPAPPISDDVIFAQPLRGGSCTKIAITQSIFEQSLKYRLVRGITGGGFRCLRGGYVLK